MSGFRILRARLERRGWWFIIWRFSLNEELTGLLWKYFMVQVCKILMKEINDCFIPSEITNLSID